MKRTTYIFIGILVSVLVILIAGVVYISFPWPLRMSSSLRV